MAFFLFVLGILTIGIGLVFAFFTSFLFDFLLTVFASLTSGMILIALSQILDNQTDNAVKIRDLERKVDHFLDSNLPTYTCSECGHTYKGEHDQCPNCFVSLKRKN